MSLDGAGKRRSKLFPIALPHLPAHVVSKANLLRRSLDLLEIPAHEAHDVAGPDVIMAQSVVPQKLKLVPVSLFVHS